MPPTADCKRFFLKPCDVLKTPAPTRERLRAKVRQRAEQSKRPLKEESFFEAANLPGPEELKAEFLELKERNCAERARAELKEEFANPLVPEEILFQPSVEAEARKGFAAGGSPKTPKEAALRKYLAEGVIKAMDAGKERKASNLAWMSKARDDGPEAWDEVLKVVPRSYGPMMYWAYEAGDFGVFNLLAEELAGELGTPLILDDYCSTDASGKKSYVYAGVCNGRPTKWVTEAPWDRKIDCKYDRASGGWRYKDGQGRPMQVWEQDDAEWDEW